MLEAFLCRADCVGRKLLVQLPQSVTCHLSVPATSRTPRVRAEGLSDLPVCCVHTRSFETSSLRFRVRGSELSSRIGLGFRVEPLSDT